MGRRSDATPATSFDRVPLEEIVHVSWEALIDPGPYIQRSASPVSTVWQLMEVVHRCWADERAAWRLSDRLVRYAQSRKCQRVGDLPAGAYDIAYSRALEVYKQVRSAHLPVG